MQPMKTISIFIILFIIIGGLWFFFDRRSDVSVGVPDTEQKQEGVAVSDEKKSDEPKTANVTDTTKKNPIVVLKTNRGDISIEMFMDTMPITVGNFIKLAEKDFYDGVKFHRVIKDFMLQGGDPNSKGSDTSSWGTGDPGYKIPDEFTAENKNSRGTIAMANAGPNTGGSQFFINLVNNDYLNSKYPVFGKVVGGMEVVDKIGAVKTGARDIPVEAIVISDVEVKR